jgi:hypothetical protein
VFECGECDGDNSSCTGCTDSSADNYDPDAIVSCNDCCEYPSYDGVIVINEINYNPGQSFEQEDSDYEFVELYNNSNTEVHLSGWTFWSNNIDYTFEDFSVEAGGYVLLSRNPDTFPGSIGYGDGSLSNSGETLMLIDSNGQTADSVTYSDGFQGDDDEWPQGADAGGSTLELINPNFDNNLAGNWQASYIIPGGTPGYENSSEPDPVYGCTDEEACNFDSEATDDDDSCEYAEENSDCEGNCLVDIDCFGECGGSAEVDDCGECEGQNECVGCTGEDSCNYDPNATIDDGSCIYPEENYDCYGNCIVEIDCFGECGGAADLDECGVCEGDNSSCTGCTDSDADNYDPDAIIDDGSCEYPDFYQVELENTGESHLIIFQDSITGLDIGDEIGVFDANGVVSTVEAGGSKTPISSPISKPVILSWNIIK